MKISEYVAQLTASGITEEVARGLAKGQAIALNLVDDVGLTKPLASGLVKGLVASGMSEDAAADVARVAIAKGSAVDDLKTEPATAPDAIAELEAASDALIKGYEAPKADKAKADAQAELDLDKGYDDDEDDEDDEDLDGDGDPNTMPARNGAVAKIAKVMKGAIDATSANLEAQFAKLTAELDALRADNTATRAQLNGIAKGIGAQGNAFVALAKGMAQPRAPKSADGLEILRTPSEGSPIQTIDYDYRASVSTAALAKGQRSNDPQVSAAFHALFADANDLTKSDAAIRDAASKLGL